MVRVLATVSGAVARSRDPRPRTISMVACQNNGKAAFGSAPQLLASPTLGKIENAPPAAS